MPGSEISKETNPTNTQGRGRITNSTLTYSASSKMCRSKQPSQRRTDSKGSKRKLTTSQLQEERLIKEQQLTRGEYRTPKESALDKRKEWPKQEQDAQQE